MMKINLSPTRVCVSSARVVLLAIILGSTLLINGCGGDASPEGTSAGYPAGVSEDIEQQLKYDSRVEAFEPDDSENLVVEVNDSWVSSPEGMQERAAGQWYALWHAGHSGKVIVKYDGNVVATCSAEGYRPEPPAAAEGEPEG
jgi:hypothetical protein